MSLDASEDVKPASAFDWVGGEAAVRRMVDRFYDLMDLEPHYAALRAAHGASLETARDKLFWFMRGSLRQAAPHCYAL